MVGGIANFFASLDPEQQRQLVDIASQALGAQHRSIGKNTANAGRVRDYLASNDAYARETAQRGGMRPAEPASESGSGVGDFQRMNDAFMKLQGDDLMPARADNAAPVTGKKPQNTGATSQRQVKQGADTKTAGNTPVNAEQDEATNDLRRDKRLPPENTSSDSNHRRGGDPDEQASEKKPDELKVNYKVPPPQEDEDDSALFDPKWLLGLAGARAVRSGGRSVSPVATPDGGVEVVDQAQSAGTRMQLPAEARGVGGVDDIIDAIWSDAADIPQEKRPAVEAPRKMLTGPTTVPANDEVARMIPAPETADIDFEDIMAAFKAEIERPQEPTRRPARGYPDVHAIVDEVMGDKPVGTGIKPPTSKKAKPPRVR